jgi:integrase
VLQVLWSQKPETASRVRARIEAVLHYAIVHGWRSGPNPAIWHGNLKLMLPPEAKLQPVKHLAALPWRAAPAFMAELRQQSGTPARALEFAILTAGRSGEVRGARWDEVDAERATWTIPAARMKAARAHRVPLSDAALAILIEQAKLRNATGLIFYGPRSGKPLQVPPLLAVLERMGHDGLTMHGFRSTFRDWCADTGKPADVAEAALAHVIGSRTVAAYARTDLFDPRRKLMAEWAEFLGRSPAVVVPMPEQRARR